MTIGSEGSNFDTNMVSNILKINAGALIIGDVRYLEMFVSFLLSTNKILFLSTTRAYSVTIRPTVYDVMSRQKQS